MGLFDTIVGAINDPRLQANAGQLGGIIDSMQQLSQSYQSNPEAVQSAMSIVGKYTRSALQQKRATEGEEQTQAFVNQYSGTHPSTQAVQMLFSAPQVQQLVGEIESRTGLNPGTIQSMLPMLVPLVLNLLQTGTDTQNPQGQNTVLQNFLDADRDGDVDISDAMQLAGRYLGR